MSTINDLKAKSLRALGYTGSIDDMYRSYLRAISGSSLNSVDDLEKLVLGGSGSINDRWKAHLDISGIRGRAMNNMLREYWSTLGAGALGTSYLFRNNEVGVWYDPSDLSTMFQDSAGTTAAVVGQPVGKILDKSGNGFHATQATSTARPVLQQDSNGKYYLAFDGTDDFMVTPSIDFSGTDKMSVFAGVRKLSDAVAGMVAELSVTAATTAGTFNIVNGAAGGPGPYWRGVSNGTTSVGVESAGFASPITNVLTLIGNISAPLVQLRANRSIIATSASTQGTGNYRSYPLYIGMRAGTSLPFNGRIYSLIVRGALSAAAQISAAESYVNSRTGAY